MAPSRFFRAALAVQVAAASVFVPLIARAQQRVALISPQQSVTDPFRNSGRLDVYHGSDGFTGTGTLIRRYTVLTAGHLLYDGATGFSTGVTYEPGLYQLPAAAPLLAASFAVLSGYQSEANLDGDSDAAFARDLGYVLFTRPAPNNDWADWQVNPDSLLQTSQKLALGYAGETFQGNALASVTTLPAFSELRDGLYESTDYYTQAGMSGGPLYAFIDGKAQVVAEIVAGTSPPQRALSDVRAITAAERALLIDPEYTQKLILEGIITGPQTVQANSSVIFKVGLRYIDGTVMGKGGLKMRYDELKLVVAGPNKKLVNVQQIKPGKYQLFFGDLPPGTLLELHLFRNTARNKDQTTLQRYMVVVQ